MSVFLMSSLTPASRTSVSSLDQPRPPSAVGRVKTAKLNAGSALIKFSKFQMPVVRVSGEVI